MMTRYILFLILLFPGFSLAKGQSLTFPASTPGIVVDEKMPLSFTFRLGVSAMSFQTVIREEGSFTQLIVPGSLRDLALPGYPDLPVFTRLIALPEGAEAEVEILQASSEVLDLNTLGVPHPLFPVQPSVSKAEDPGSLPIIYNRTAYGINAFPDHKQIRVEYLGKLRGVRVARLTIAPFRYNPVRNLVEVTFDMKVKIHYVGADLAATRANRLPLHSPLFQTSYQTLINYLPEPEQESAHPFPMKYVIIADPMFQSALQPFVAWKMRKGFQVVEAYTNDPLVGNTTTSIKNYLQSLYLSATPSDPAPTFALLVGDVAQIPAFSGTTGSHPTDLYYFEYDGGGDYIPELYYGRFSANNLAELQPQIDKTLEYEQFLMPDTAFLSKVVMVSGVDSYYASTHGNGQINYGTSYYFNQANGLTSSTYLYPASANYSSQIISDISAGVGFANYTAHCGVTGWSDPAFTTAHVNSLQNTSKYPLIIGNCCQSNKFDQTCFGEALLRAPGKGAMGYIGGSNNTLWDEDFYWSVGVGTPVANPTYAGTGLGAYDKLFHLNGEPRAEWYEANGQINMAGNLAVSASTSTEIKYYWEIYHLMGDPSVMTFLGNPKPLAINHPSFHPLGLNTFSLTTEPYAQVGLSKDGVLHGGGIADSLGALSMNILPFTSPGHAQLVVSKQNRIPYIDSILVAAPNGPYVLMNQFVIQDSLGNANGRADYGEFIQLDISLVNYGNTSASMVQSILSTSDTLVILHDSTETWGTLGPGDTLVHPLAFAFSVLPFVPDGHRVPLMISITDSAGNLWTSSFFVKLHAPKLEVLGLSLDDASSGNGNGAIDPGETVDLHIRVINNGGCEALNAVASLVTYHPLVSITNGSILLDTLHESQSLVMVFSVQVDATIPLGEVFEVHASLSSGWYSHQLSFAPMVGSITEDWETGTMSKLSWVSGGNQPWHIVNTNAYEGMYAARSGNIGNSQQSTLEITLNVLTNDSISFFRKVSSENNYDWLQFFIDNNLVDQWSGNKDWARVAYPVFAGSRTFRWVYVKDWYLASGSDCAWIDYIRFPAVAGIVTGEEVLEAPPAMLVYPNPARGSVRLLLRDMLVEPASLQVFDASGRVLHSTVIPVQPGKTHYLDLDISGFGPGLAYLSLVSGQTRLVEKLIVLP